MAADENLFELLGVPIVSGRPFDATDADAEVPPVIVDQTFVESVMGGASPLGRRIRAAQPPAAEPAPWEEIIGVVADLVDNPMSRQEVGGMIFRPLGTEEGSNGIRLIAHVPSSPADFAPELQRLATAVDPTLPVSAIMPLDSSSDPLTIFTIGIAIGVGLVLLSVLLLCSAGIFALISFNVTQRRREIGIRSALGAGPGRVLASVMVRSIRQLAIGVGVGIALVAAMPDLVLDGLVFEIDARLILAVAALIVLVGLLAAAGPVRAGLRVQPTEALKEG
jgi:putative ABC transport system permease protein